MFKQAIEKVAQFTRPIHTIHRNYNSKKIIGGAATLFFVNEEGYAITCKHVAEILINAENLSKKYNDFKIERNQIPRNGKYSNFVRNLEKKNQFADDTQIQLKYTFVDCIDNLSGFTTTLHPKFDLAIIKFNDFGKVLYSNYAIFKKNTSEIGQGEYLCRLGFPFPEFNNFMLNETTDEIEWTNEGVRSSPRFPIDGMITRFLADNGKINGIEMSTPGLRGQSGGPLFDSDGTIYGMQSSTKHLHLGFDLIDTEIMVNNRTKKVSDYSFIHLGQCVHVEVIKDFLRENNVKFYEV